MLVNPRGRVKANRGNRIAKIYEKSNDGDTQVMNMKDLKMSRSPSNSSPTPLPHGTYMYEESNKKRQTNLKKKTELCKSYSMTGHCEYGELCSFAHGASELRLKVLVPNKYKTVKCANFHKEGYCRFGARCQFIHEKKPEKKAKKVNKGLLRCSYEIIQWAMEQHFLKDEEDTNVREDDWTPFGGDLSLKTFKKSTLRVFEELKRETAH